MVRCTLGLRNGFLGHYPWCVQRITTRETMSLLRNGAAAPEIVGGYAEEEEDDGGHDVAETDRVMEGQEDGVGDDGGCGQNENEWRHGITGYAIGSWLSCVRPANREDAGGAESVENPSYEDRATCQFGESGGGESEVCV